MRNIIVKAYDITSTMIETASITISNKVVHIRAVAVCRFNVAAIAFM